MWMQVCPEALTGPVVRLRQKKFKNTAPELELALSSMDLRDAWTRGQF